MSALWAPITQRPSEPEAPARTRAALRSVATPAPRLARFPFLVVLMGVFGLGMAGLLMLNTTLQGQAFQVRSLSRQAAQLTYTQTELEGQIDALAAPQELARRASRLGMRANTHPAFLVLPKGKVIGKPTPVTGNEAPLLIVKTPAEKAADKAAAKEAKLAKIKAKAAKEKAKAAKEKAKAAREKKAAQDAKAKKPSKKQADTPAKKKPDSSAKNKTDSAAKKKASKKPSTGSAGN